MKTACTALFFILLLFSLPSRAMTIDTPAKHVFMMDFDTGAVLMNKAGEEKMPTSSMSKTMTLYMVFDALKQGKLKLDDELPVSEKAWKMEGSRMFLNVNTRARVEDLIRGVAIQSGNDASVTLAEGLAGTEESFAERMNVKAKELGMLNSHFMNASGFPDPEHYSTAHDLAILASRLISDFPDYYHYFGEKEFTYNKIRQSNRDPLLGKVPGADGLKTGHTEIAGYGLIGSAKRGERRLVMVINGLTSEKERAAEGEKILEWGFRNFENKKLFAKGDAVGHAKVWLGVQDDVPLVVPRDIMAVVPSGSASGAKISIVYKSPLPAPVKKDTAVARLRIALPGESATTEIDLLAGSDVPRKGFFGRAFGRIRYLLSGM